MRIRKIFTIAGPVYYADKYFSTGHPDKNKELYEKANQLSTPIRLNIENIQFSAMFQGAKMLIVEGEYPDDNVLFQYMTDANIPEDTDLEDGINMIDEAAERVLEIVKYIFDFPPIEEYLKFAKPSMEVYQTNNWLACADRRRYKWVPAETMLCLDATSVKTLQGLLNDGIEPLHAMKFLSKAKREENLRDKCLLLATAAEQAIKEYFVRIGHPKNQWGNENIEGLYDNQLTIVSGASSPHLAGILENSRIRNKIVHRPAHDPKITAADSIRLTDEVERGILHLMKLQYPGNNILDDLYNKVDNSRP